MIEFSITEIILFGWSVLATAQAFRYKDELKKTNFVLKLMLNEDKIRDELVRDFQEFKQANK